MNGARRMRRMRAAQTVVLLAAAVFFVLGVIDGKPFPAVPAAVAAISATAICWESGVIARREKTGATFSAAPRRPPPGDWARPKPTPRKGA